MPAKAKAQAAKPKPNPQPAPEHAAAPTPVVEAAQQAPAIVAGPQAEVAPLPVEPPVAPVKPVADYTRAELEALAAKKITLEKQVQRQQRIVNEIRNLQDEDQDYDRAFDPDKYHMSEAMQRLREAKEALDTFMKGEHPTGCQKHQQALLARIKKVNSELEKQNAKRELEKRRNDEKITTRAMLAEQHLLDFYAHMEQAETAYLDLYQEFRRSQSGACPLDSEEMLARLNRINENVGVLGSNLLLMKYDERTNLLDHEQEHAVRDRLDVMLDEFKSAVLKCKGFATAFDLWESWDAAVEDASHDAPAKLEAFLESVPTVYEYSEKESITFIRSHPQLHASRVAGMTHAYMMAQKTMRRDYPFGDGKRTALVDVGAGIYGLEALARLKMQGKNRDYFFHAMIPLVDADDERRWKAMRKVAGIKYNHIRPGTRPALGNTVNYCHHKASECTCIDHFDQIVPVCVHSGYYLLQDDFHNLFRKAKEILSIEHYPTVGEHLPAVDPEFEWKDATASDSGNSWWSRAGALLREGLTGVKQVVMKPVVPGCTTYRHPDNHARFRNGGFHSSSMFRLADRLGNNPASALKLAAATAGSGAITHFLSTPGDLTVRTICGVVGGLAVGLGSLVGIRLANGLARTTTPSFLADYTVSVHARNSMALTKTREVISHIAVYQKHEQPVELTQQVATRDVVDEKHIGRATAGLLLGNGTSKARDQMAASMLRADVPINAVKGTLNAAYRALNYFAGPAPDGPPRTPYLRWATACFSLPCAWGVAKISNYLLGAKFSLLLRSSTAFATAAQAILPIFLFYCAVFNPMIALMGTFLGVMLCGVHMLSE